MHAQANVLEEMAQCVPVQLDCFGLGMPAVPVQEGKVKTGYIPRANLHQHCPDLSPNRCRSGQTGANQKHVEEEEGHQIAAWPR